MSATHENKRKPRRFKTRESVVKQIDRANDGITKLKQNIQTIEDAKELMHPEMVAERRKLTDKAEALWHRITYRERRLKRLQSTLAMFDTEVMAGMGERDVVLQRS